jgi:hypothetical protein
MPLHLLKNAEHVDKASNISPMRQGMMLRTDPVFGDLGGVLEITPISPFHAIEVGGFDQYHLSRQVEYRLNLPH